MTPFNSLSIGVILIILPAFIQGQYNCVGRPDGFYPHPSDCESYFICAVGTVFTVKCAAGLHFSATQKYCDTPQSAKCASLPLIQPTQQPVTQQTTPTSTKLIFPITQSTKLIFPVRQTTQPKPITQKATTGVFPFWIFTSRPTVFSPTTIHPKFPVITSGPGNLPTSSIATFTYGTVKPVISK